MEIINEKIYNKEKLSKIKNELIDITMSCNHAEALQSLTLIQEVEHRRNHPDIYVLKACLDLKKEINKVIKF